MVTREAKGTLEKRKAEMNISYSKIESTLSVCRCLISKGPPTVLPFQPKYRLGHPENYLFLLSKKLFIGSKYPKINLFNFEKNFTAHQHRSTTEYVFILHGGGVSWQSKLQATAALSTCEVECQGSDAVLPFSKLNNFIFGYFDPENVFFR